MTLDARTLIAIVCQEPGWEAVVDRVLRADHRRVPATALAEAGMVLTAQNNSLGSLEVRDVVRELRLVIVPFTEADWSCAVIEYFNRRRSGRAETARFGDCLTAAVAARTGAPVVGSR
jgi:uncharacterized protein with PIN domain